MLVGTVSDIAEYIILSLLSLFVFLEDLLLQLRLCLDVLVDH